MTRLMWACAKGYLPRVRELIAWASDIHAVDARGWTPLHIASEAGHKEVVRELLAHGAEIEATDKDGDTPLHLACITGRQDAARELLGSGADAMAENEKGNTPLHFAYGYDLMFFGRRPALPPPATTPSRPHAPLSSLPTCLAWP